MAKDDKLAKYRSMRSKDKTPEPFTSKTANPAALSFVIQKHKATALHYDFRLEVNGAMPSWAVPKGPSLDSSVKRLAMQTEDHPIDYQHFEGEIPEGQYGVGQVIIWDKGTYIPEMDVNGKRVQIDDKKTGEKIMEEGIKKGEIKFFLNGKRLKGSFALVKTKGFPPTKKDNAWLLIKHKDKYTKAGYDAKKFTTSVVSNRSLKP
ncbi:MAG: 3'-phosphoesterase [Candidatus Curtissbacteria bacterium]|nr:3'-phosphoesterase [Candidatus Curtissbacteria bacterium]